MRFQSNSAVLCPGGKTIRSRQVTTWEDILTFHLLKAQGCGISEIAGATGRDRKTVRKNHQRIKKDLGRAKPVGVLAQTFYRGRERVWSRFILTMAAKDSPGFTG